MARELSPSEKAHADRMRRLRLYHGYGTQTAFATWLGLSLTRWNNYEKSGLPLGKDVEDLLVQRTPGLTLDWLRHGERRGLSVELDRRLHEPDAGRVSRGRRGRKKAVE